MIAERKELLTRYSGEIASLKDEIKKLKSWSELNRSLDSNELAAFTALSVTKVRKY